MLIKFEEFKTGAPISINYKNVVCVFNSKDPKTQKEITVINMINGNISVTDDYATVISRINTVHNG